jgi:hypothetical protein
MSVRSWLLVLVALVSFSGARLIAQTNATVSGVITDQMGGRIVDASIELTNLNTGVLYKTSTNSVGFYSIGGLLPGTYRAVINKQGFSGTVMSEIELHVQDVIALNFTMRVGSVSETVQVEGGAPMVNTEGGAVSTVVDREFMENTPLNGRSFQSMLLLTPGIALTTNVQGTNAGGSFSVDGQRPASNGFSVDGVNANFAASPGSFSNFQTSGNLPALTVLGTTQTLASVDAVQEFKVQTSTYNAEFGPQPGAQISIITRSGTNQFHGSGFDYLRNDLFDANDWFADENHQPKAPERQNDFGGTFGGPVFIPHVYNGHNRTFFFVSYEGLRLRLPQFSVTNVPSLCERGQGNCAAGQNPGAASLFPILNAFPLPNGANLICTAPTANIKCPAGTPNGLANYSASYSNPSSVDTLGIRVDHTVGRVTLFGRYNRSPSESTSRSLSDLAVQGLSGLQTWTLTSGANIAINPHMSDELKANYSSNDTKAEQVQTTFGGAVPVARSLLVPSGYDSPFSAGSYTLQAFSGGIAPFPSVGVPGLLDSSQHQFTVLDNFTWAVGSHRLKFGGGYRHLTPTVGPQVYNLLGLATSPVDVQNGVASLAIIQGGIQIYPIFDSYWAFAQDTWRVSSRLSLDYGVRWDLIPPPTEANGHLGVAVNEVQDLSTMQLAPIGTQSWQTTKANFAPRLGVAYQFNKSPNYQTVIRGGFGLFYDTGNDRSTQNAGRFPWSSQLVTAGVGYPLNTAKVAPIPVPTPLTTPYPGGLVIFDPNLKLPYTYEWNVGIDQSVGKNQAITITYTGNAGRELLQDTVRNLSSTGINKNFPSIGLVTNTANSDYDGLQTQYRRRLSHGLQALASYTWSHAIDTDSDSNTGRLAMRGNSAYDLHHVVSAAVTYDFPTPPNTFMRALLGHWSTDTSFHAQSAAPVDLVASTTTSTIDGSTINVRPNYVPGAAVYLYGDACTASNGGNLCPGGRRINPAAFSIPTAGQSGDVGRNQLRGLGAWQQDVAIRREFPIFENLKLQFRAEAFNLYNHPNFGFASNSPACCQISSTLSSPTFGMPTTMLNRSVGGMSSLYQIGGPRSFQFAIKLVF